MNCTKCGNEIEFTDSSICDDCWYKEELRDFIVALADPDFSHVSVVKIADQPIYFANHKDKDGEIFEQCGVDVSEKLSRFLEKAKIKVLVTK